jgi:hypothetical protein
VTKSAIRNQTGLHRFTAQFACGSAEQVTICRSLLGSNPLFERIERQTENTKIIWQTFCHGWWQRVGVQKSADWTRGIGQLRRLCQEGFAQPI